MDAIASVPCCEGSRADATGEPAIEASDCCEELRLGALPTGTAPTSMRGLAAPLTAVIPPIGIPTTSGVRVVREVTLDAWHRGPPRPAEARTRTMVFLI
jgi:hypothetical protein